MDNKNKLIQIIRMMINKTKMKQMKVNRAHKLIEKYIVNKLSLLLLKIDS
jgi:hypothetical protein